MRKRKLIHPRKAMWAMRDFINEIHQLTYTVLDFPYIEGETNEEFWRRLNNAPEVEKRSSVKLVKSFGFWADTTSRDDIEFKIGYNFEELWQKGSLQFSQDFFSRCPMGRGFASVTLSILHELGHLHAQQDFEGYDREIAIQELRKNFPPAIRNLVYFKLPDEMAATDWAIEWLSNAENRKIAKRFEKKFFECFE